MMSGDFPALKGIYTLCTRVSGCQEALEWMDGANVNMLYGA